MSSKIKHGSMFSKNEGPYSDPRLARYDHLIVHCTATPPRLDADAAWVDRLHRARGWNGCGYHAVITRDGVWQDADGGHPARPIGRSGAHVGSCGRGWNGRSFGVALTGGVEDRNPDRAEDNFTPYQGATLYRGILRFLRLHPDPDTVLILGHRDLIVMTGAPPKDCPSFDVGGWLAMVRGLDAWREMI
jgi:N-acetylmuramoyl-L-alanine amidase